MGAWILIYLLLSAAGTWLARRYALHRQLIDEPGERRSHTTATPRGGGIAIVAALLVATVALGLRMPSYAPLAAAFAVGLALIAGIGLIDDHRPLSPWLRLAVHALAAAGFGYAYGHVTGQWWLALCGFAGVLVLTNVWNFMDGINGMAATQAAIAAAGLALLGGPVWAWLALALMAACLGFLPFNFPRARIFMGDVGSGALGYAVAALSILAAGRLGDRAPALLLPLMPFLVDSGLTLMRRVLRGERWWTAHAQHAYQVWAREVGHSRVTLVYAFYSVLAVLGLPYVIQSRSAFILGIGLACYTSGAFFWWLLQRRGTGPAARPV